MSAVTSKSVLHFFESITPDSWTVEASNFTLIAICITLLGQVHTWDKQMQSLWSQHKVIEVALANGMFKFGSPSDWAIWKPTIGFGTSERKRLILKNMKNKQQNQIFLQNTGNNKQLSPHYLTRVPTTFLEDTYVIHFLDSLDSLSLSTVHDNNLVNKSQVCLHYLHNGYHPPVPQKPRNSHPRRIILMNCWLEWNLS